MTLHKKLTYLSISLFYLCLLTANNSNCLELKDAKHVNVNNILSKDIFYDKTGFNFYGIKIEPSNSGCDYAIMQGNKKDEVFSNRSSVEDIIDSTVVYERFPENNSFSVVFSYGTGVVCCNEYIILTKTESKYYGNIVNSGRVQLKIANINDTSYMLTPLSDFNASDLGAGFKPYPYRVMVFEDGTWRYGKRGEHKDAYEWLIKETKNDINNNLKKKSSNDLDIHQDIVFPSVEIAFYQIMLNADKKSVISDLTKALPQNKKKFAQSYFKEVVESANNTILPAENRQIFKKGSNKFLNY